MPDFDFDTVESLFIRCLDLAPHKRLTWLKKQCNDNPALFDDVESLLQAHEQSENFLSEPVQFETLSPEQKAAFAQQSEAKHIGKTVGVYQLDSLLGRGGMGLVYLAHRIDGEYEQEVAIKIVESSTLEMLLFKRERQILANLNHPNIVTLLDGGTLPDTFEHGGSYFVMEHIKGSTIDDYVKENQLTERQIIRLMLKLGLVIQDAHQHGIIHCDIKPANVLIGDDGILKLLDFGIAQLLNNPTPEKKNNTSKRFALTPEYSSPRRHQQHTPVISDDIFSLGILLSHTLSGKIPAVIVPDFMPFPEPDIARTARHINNDELRKIFFKATHPVEKQRYSSAKSFVNDLQNWLEHRPVQAVGNNSFYLLRKNIQRNWQYWGVISALLIILIVAISTWLHKARLEKESMQTQQTTESLLSDLDSTLESLPQTTLIRKKLIETAYKRIKQYSQQAPNNIAIKKMQADILNRLAEVTGHPYALNQGNSAEALNYYQQALNIYQTLRLQREDHIAAEVDIANTQRKVAEIMAYQGDITGGLKLMEEKRLHMEKVFANTPLEYRLPMVILYTVEAHGNFHAKNLTKAQTLIDKAWEIARANTHPDTKYYLILAFLHEETGHLALLKHDYTHAKQEYLNVINKYQHNDLWQHKRRLARVHNGLACIALQAGDIATAKQHTQQIQQAYQALNSKYPNAKAIQNKLQSLYAIDAIIKQNDKNTPTALSKAIHCDQPLAFMIPPADKTVAHQ